MPRSARIIGLLGLLPFWGPAALLWAGPDAWQVPALRGQLAYGAAILAFMGGTHWGFALSTEGGRSHYALGVPAAVIAAISILVHPARSLPLLIAGFALTWLIDERWTPAVGPMQARAYRRLRRALSLSAIAALVASWAAMGFSS